MMKKKQMAIQNENLIAEIIEKSDEIDKMKLKIEEKNQSLQQNSELIKEKNSLINKLEEENTELTDNLEIITQKLRLVSETLENFKLSGNNQPNEESSEYVPEISALEHKLPDNNTDITIDCENENFNEKDNVTDTENSMPEGFRIPDFGQNDTDFETFFGAEKDENEASDEPYIVDEITETKENDVKVKACDDISKINAEKLYTSNEMEDYCARLIGRVTVAAARVMANIGSSNDSENDNIKSIAMGKTELFKAEVVSELQSGESGEILKSKLESLAAGTENYLNRLS